MSQSLPIWSCDTGRPRRVGGYTRIPVEFQERERPTLIRNMKGEPVFIKGEPVDLDNRHEALYRKYLKRLESVGK